MAQQVKRDAHKPDHDSCTCPWCGGKCWKWVNTTEKTKCMHCLGKGKVSSEKAATYQNSWIAQRRQHVRRKRKEQRVGYRVRCATTWNPKDDPNHPYWDKV
jgi:hypothetical protein